MNNLIPEKRMDKNGRLVTRHVSMLRTNGPSANLPVATGNPIDKLTPDQLVERDWKLTSVDFAPSPELEATWRKKLHLYKFTASDKTFYAMLRAVNIDDAILMLAHGIDTPMKALSYLKKKKLDHHIVDGDSSREFSRAIYRGITSKDLMAVRREFLYGKFDPATPYSMLDAAEAYGFEKLREYNLWKRVACGDIHIEELHAIGEDRIAGYENSGQILELIMSANERNLTINETAQLIDRLHKEKDASWLTVDDLLDKFTPQQISTLYSLRASASMSFYLGNARNAEDRYAKTSHYDAIVKLSEKSDTGFNWKTMNFEDVESTFEAGLTPEESMDCLSQGMTANQYIAVRDHGIAPSVSGGWL